VYHAYFRHHLKPDLTDK